MSVNLYFDNKVRELPGFKSQPYSDGSGYKCTLNGTSLYSERGQLYMAVDDDCQVPEELKGLIEYVTLRGTFPRFSDRESGVYGLGSAEAELEFDRSGVSFKIRMRAKNLDDIRVLLRKIKAGTIRPEESFEKPQVGKTRQQLEVDLATAEAEAQRLRDQVAAFHKRTALILALMNELTRKGTWVVRVAYIVRRLNQILYSK